MDFQRRLAEKIKLERKGPAVLAAGVFDIILISVCHFGITIFLKICLSIPQSYQDTMAVVAAAAAAEAAARRRPSSSSDKGRGFSHNRRRFSYACTSRKSSEAKIDENALLVYAKDTLRT